MKPSPGELAAAYTAGMKAEQSKGRHSWQGPAVNPHPFGSPLSQEWTLGFRDSKADRANRERAADERLDADTEWDE